MTRWRPNLHYAAASGALACGLALAYPAGAQVVTQEMLVSTSATVATNPYLQDTDEGASVGATVEIRPRLSYDTSVTQLSLEGFAQATAYAAHYGVEDNYSVAGSLRHRPSEQLTVLANLGFSSYGSPQVGAFLDTGGGATPSEPVPPPPPVDDITVLGQRGRTNSISAGAGVEYAVDSLNSLALHGSYRKELPTYAGAADYEVRGIQGRYDRVLNERTTIGLVTSYQQFDYQEGQPDSRSISAEGSLSLQLTEGWSLSGSAGIQNTRVEESLVSPVFTNTSFTASAGLCRQDPRENLCLSYTRQSLPTSYAGVRISDAVALSYSVRVSEYDTVALGGSYSRNSSLGGIDDPSVTQAGVRGSFERRFNERFTGYVEGSLDRSRGGAMSIDPRARVSAGVRYLFGRNG